ncbi:polymer-forming cytoskeletal protein [Salinibaculum salinum]|uniref:bactofilin family protein n=1 Tax=Salinibaculum salinum TaxID=3131996 RepID=UPI0030EDA3D7
MPDTSLRRTAISTLAVAIVVLSLFSGVTAAQSGVGGTTVVERGETVSSVSGVYGTIIIEGTVTGDVSGLAGNVVIREGGVVEGSLDAAAGNIRIAGTVRDTVSTGSGSVHLTETGIVEGDFVVGAGDVRIDGTIQGDAQIGAETIRLGETATIAGSLTYDGSLQGNRDAVSGEVTRDRSLGGDIFTDLQPLATGIFAINAFLLNLGLGVLLLGLFPKFSDRLADRVATDTVRSGLLGLGVFIAVPLVFFLVAITVIGIPISIAGLLAFLAFAWIGLVYGRFAVGVWLLSLADVENRWAGLIAGLILGAFLGLVPIIGGLLNFAIFVLGLGALVLGLVDRRRRVKPTPEQPTAESAAE